jgi:Matrixin
LKALVAGFVGLLCILGTPVSAQDAGLFKILKLEGHQVRWPSPQNGAPLVVTYRVVNEQTEFPGARNCRKITGVGELLAASNVSDTAFRAELAAAFAMWEAAANITFKEAPEGTRADVLIGAQVDPEGWAFAEVFYDTASREAVRPISRALVCLNPQRRWKVGFDGDLRTYDLRYTLAHEIGHAIGLDHPQGGNQIMGYRYEEGFRTLQPGDVRGAVLIYGEPNEHAEIAQADGIMSLAAAPSSPARRFAKRWGTRGLAARSSER